MGSSLNVESGAATVGNWGQGSLTITNGAQVVAGDFDNHGIGMDVGRGANGNGTVSVQDVYEFDGDGNLSQSVFTASNLTVNSGALAVGYNGLGVLNISNGGVVTASGTDNIHSGLYVGYSNGSNGTINVDGVRTSANLDVFDDSSSQLLVTFDAGIIGHSGQGTLNLTNGGYANFSGEDHADIGLYIGNNSDGTGTVNVDGMSGQDFGPPISHPSIPFGTPSEMDVTSGALIVGASGTGILNVTNGGYVDVAGNDGNIIGLYLGANCGSTGTVTVDGVNTSGLGLALTHPANFGGVRSELDVDNGAVVVGGNGYGHLNITNGAIVNIDGTTGNGNGLFIGQGGHGSGDVNIDGVFTFQILHGPFLVEKSELDVNDGATIVGFDESGNLTVTNGGLALLSGTDANGRVAAYLGYNCNVNGNLTVTGIRHL